MISAQKISFITILISLGCLIIFGLPTKSQAAVLRTGDLITRKSGGDVYLVDHNKRRPVLSMSVFKQRGYRWKNVRKLSNAAVTSIPVSHVLSYKNGTLMRAKGHTRIWIMDKGYKKFISSKQVLQILGLQNKRVRVISYRNLFRIRPGGAMDLGITKFIAVTSINKPFWVKDGSNNKIIQLKAREIVKVGYKRGFYLISIPSRGKTIQTKRWIQILPSSGGVVKLPYYDKAYGYNQYRGGMWIQYSSKSKRLWAINKVRLEDYLKGMGEAGDTYFPDNEDPIAYQKVMAVVARSYASFYLKRGGRHTGETFYLKDSRYNNGNDQVYHGYKREFTRQKKAVNGTRGYVVIGSISRNILITPYSHGGYIKETRSKCSANNGKWLTNRKVCLRTKSSEQVWGGSLPGCQPAYDPYTDRHWECGARGNHCVGLSAQGAVGYSEIDKSYVWILKHYYSNTVVKNQGYNPWNRVAIYGLRP